MSLTSCEDDQESDCKICATILETHLMERQFLSTLRRQLTELAGKRAFISNIINRNIRVLGNLEALRDLRSLSLVDIGKGLDFTYIDLQYPLVIPTEMTANEGVSLICDTPLKLPLATIFEDGKFTMLSTNIHQKRLSGVACTSGDFSWICGPDHATFYKVNKKSVILTRISININPIYICANERTIFYSNYTDNSIYITLKTTTFMCLGKTPVLKEPFIHTTNVGALWLYPILVLHRKIASFWCASSICTSVMEGFVHITPKTTILYRLLSTWMIVTQFPSIAVCGPSRKTSMETSGSWMARSTLLSLWMNMGVC